MPDWINIGYIHAGRAYPCMDIVGHGSPRRLWLHFCVNGIAVFSEMEVTAGLIQKLVDENATRKLDQHDYREKYDGYASRYVALESRMDSLEKERERK